MFERGLSGAPNQLHQRRDDVAVTAEELLDLASTPGTITETGLRTDVNVGFQYISFWLTGHGAAAINSLMEDAATAEISRSQIWQWIRHEAKLDDGRTVTRELVREVPRRGDGDGSARAWARRPGAPAGRRRRASCSTGSRCRPS